MFSTSRAALAALALLAAGCAPEAGAPFPPVPMGFSPAQNVAVQARLYDPAIATDMMAAATAFATENETVVLFAPGSALVEPEAWPALDAQAAWLARNPLTAVRLTGHPDAPGAPEDNARLARQRASAAARHLIARGVDPLRIAVVADPGLPPEAVQTAAAEARARRVFAEIAAVGRPSRPGRPADGERAIAVMEQFRDPETRLTPAESRRR